MTTRVLRAFPAVLALAVLGPMLALGVSTVTADPAAAVGRYTPKTGATFSNPLRPEASRRIIRHKVRTINSVPRGEKIRIISWNVKSGLYRDALIRAHKRGVSVRVLMAGGVADRQGPSGDFHVLKRRLSEGNARRKPAMRSFMRKCVRSCRGTLGIAHAKSFVFSKAGKAEWIVMGSSANATEVAARVQWNDAYTVVGQKDLYRKAVRVFNEAARDRRASPPYLSYNYAPGRRAFFQPYAGRHSVGDPVMRLLAPVKCRGARRAGVNGRTAIRIAQTAILDERGVSIARRLKSLWNHGCNIRIAYTVLGPQIQDILRSPGGRGRVPMRQIAQDFDRDGSFDRYLHSKAMTISGHYGQNRSARITLNGSANWTKTALRSDEISFVLRDPATEQKYASWINGLFTQPPLPGQRTAMSEPVSREVLYKNVQIH
ncbi:MAG TPA: phospholipase D-like domain-containing protein [Nocardioides sp.]|nr:phospholipase D-like domain-containing protein [Nocardioides sp.]